MQVLEQYGFRPTLGSSQLVPLLEVVTERIDPFQEFLMLGCDITSARPILVIPYPIPHDSMLELAQRTGRDETCAVRSCHALECFFKHRTLKR